MQEKEEETEETQDVHTERGEANGQAIIPWCAPKSAVSQYGQKIASSPWSQNISRYRNTEG